jgi:hypothetical protein
LAIGLAVVEAVLRQVCFRFGGRLEPSVLGIEEETRLQCDDHAAAQGAGLPVTMHAVRAEDAGRWVEMGFDEIVLPADIELIRGAFEGTVARARQLLSA